jgi:hypothetical protein
MFRTVPLPIIKSLCTVHLTAVYVIQVCTLQFYPGPARKPHLILDVRSFADEQVSGSLMERWGRTLWPLLAPALTAFVVVSLGFVKDHFYPAPLLRLQVFWPGGLESVPRTAPAVGAAVLHLVIEEHT